MLSDTKLHSRHLGALFNKRFLPNTFTWWLHKWTEVGRHIHHRSLQGELVETIHIRTWLSLTRVSAVTPMNFWFGLSVSKSRKPRSKGDYSCFLWQRSKPLSSHTKTWEMMLCSTTTTKTHEADTWWRWMWGRRRWVKKLWLHERSVSFVVSLVFLLPFFGPTCGTFSHVLSVLCRVWISCVFASPPFVDSFFSGFSPPTNLNSFFVSGPSTTAQLVSFFIALSVLNKPLICLSFSLCRLQTPCLLFWDWIYSLC